MSDRIIRVWLEYQDEHGDSYMTPAAPGECVCAIQDEAVHDINRAHAILDSIPLGVLSAGKV